MTDLQMKGAKASAIDTLSIGIAAGAEKGSKAIAAAAKSESKALEVVKGYYKANPKLYSSDKIAKSRDFTCN